MRDVRNTQREGPKPRPVVQPDEDEGADAGGEKPGDEDNAHERAGKARCLHQEKGADDRRPEQGGDRGKAAGGPNDERGHRRRILLHQMHRQHAEPAADRDQRGLGPEHRTQAEGGQGGQDDPGEVERVGRPAGLEAFGRLVATGSMEILQREADQQAAQHQGHNRPPGRRRVEPEILGKGDEDEFLGFGDELQIEVSDGRNRHPDHRPEYHQRQVAPAPEERGGIGAWSCRRLRRAGPAAGSTGPVIWPPGSRRVPIGSRPRPLPLPASSTCLTPPETRCTDDSPGSPGDLADLRAGSR